MIKSTPCLEICSGSLTSALIAQSGGADRIELCENLSLGGTTPGFGTLSLARQLVYIPIHVLIRPRGGDFNYSDIELAVMKMDIESCKELGMDGVVFGILNPDNTVNKNHCLALLEAARPMSVTFHRAFDDTADPIEALEDIIQLGFDYILTSGQQKTALEGVELLEKLNTRAGKRIIIMPGGEIRPDNISEILTLTKAKYIHSSAIKNSTLLQQETDIQIVKMLKEILTTLP